MQGAAEGQPFAAMFGQKLRQIFFVNWALTCVQRGQFAFVIVNADDLVPQFGKASCRNQSYVSGTHNRYAHLAGISKKGFAAGADGTYGRREACRLYLPKAGTPAGFWDAFAAVRQNGTPRPVGLLAIRSSTLERSNSRNLDSFRPLRQMLISLVSRDGASCLVVYTTAKQSTSFANYAVATVVTARCEPRRVFAQVFGP
jgi:hypothetical protein